MSATSLRHDRPALLTGKAAGAGEERELARRIGVVERACRIAERKPRPGVTNERSMRKLIISRLAVGQSMVEVVHRPVLSGVRNEAGLGTTIRMAGGHPRNDDCATWLRQGGLLAIRGPKQCGWSWTDILSSRRARPGEGSRGYSDHRHGDM